MPESQRIEKMVFFISALILMFTAGAITGEKLNPTRRFQLTTDSLFEIMGLKLPKYYQQTDNEHDKPLFSGGKKAQPGWTLISKIGPDRAILVDLVDQSGDILKSWNLDWFKLWPDATHVPESLKPQSRPGTHVHGIALMKDGGLLFNFEYLGLIRLDHNGDVLWKLDRLTHHSLEVDSDGNIWVCAIQYHTQTNERFPNFSPPFYEDLILMVSPQGKVIREWSIRDILVHNDLEGLLHLGTTENMHTMVSNDPLHLNDAEPYPGDWETGFFNSDDVMVSVRNINTVFVFDRDTLDIKYRLTGQFVRQHDPDFLDSSRISVYDNNNISAYDRKQQSRILVFSAPAKQPEVYFEGNESTPFYSAIMGKHQWLPNGNLLITDSVLGRGIEITPQKEVVWTYTNYVAPGIVGQVDEFKRIPDTHQYSIPTP